jgi:Zn-dependent protease
VEGAFRVLYLLRRPAELLGVALALLIGVVAHSLAQAAAARGLGDRMPAASGRLNPDPRRHFDPFGVIVMLVSGVGWNKPVPLQEPRFKGTRGRYVLAILAGPAANLVLATLALVGLRLLGTAALDSVDPRLFPPDGFLRTVVFEIAVVNSALGLLSLIPLPPLDGARILWVLAPKSHGWRQARYHLEERNIGLGICVVLFLPLFGGMGLLMSLVVSLSEAFLAPICQALGVGVGF